jgi:hypothetical protein
MYRGPMRVNKVIRKDIYEVLDLISNKVSQVHISRMHGVRVASDTALQDILKIAGYDHHEFVVESILDHRRTGTRKRDLEFLVRWYGYEPSDDSWEPFENLKEVAALDEYSKQHPELNLG